MSITETFEDVRQLDSSKSRAPRALQPTRRGLLRCVSHADRLATIRGVTDHHTLPRAKIAITVDETALAEIDRLVRQGVFPNRSKAIEEAVHDRIARLQRSRLARECAKLYMREEQALADEGYVGESEWPAY